MATLTTDRRSGEKPGYNIQWIEGKQRRTLHLGGKRYDRKTALRLKDVIERLLYYRWNPDVIPDKMTMHWLQHAPEEIRDKLARAGLIAVDEKKTCKHLWEAFLNHKKDLKPSTIDSYKACQTFFFETFLPTEPIEKITSDRLSEWRTSLLVKNASTSVACYMKVLKTVFNFAVDRDWLAKSPLRKIPTGSFKNKKARRKITLAEYAKLLEACPSQEWRVIIALARIGGLRCPSELQQLRWKDVDWEGNRFLVKSPKTERHEEHSERFVPLFPELRMELERLHTVENEFVIQGFQGTDWIIYPQFQAISESAGLGKIKSPFRNMRRSRSNEVMREHGSQLESLWIGHSEKVMEDHYFELEDEDFVKALG